MTSPLGRHVLILIAVCARPAAADWLFQQEVIATPVRERFSVCLDHTCKTIVTRFVSEREWGLVTAPLREPPASAAAERAALAQAIGRMEAVIGPKTGTSGDRGGNLQGFGQQGQMDCIDESTNTTTYLKLLQQDGLLRYHTVQDRATRFGLFAGMPHTTAVIRENASQLRYAVDSWFLDNGEPPAIVELSLWRSGWEPGEDARE